MPTIHVVRGDICTIDVDAVVTAANRSLVGGSGVNGAVHAAAGPELVKAARAFAPCEPGCAVVTPAFEMPYANWVIHAVGPQYTSKEDEPLLASAYTAALALADEVEAHSVAFPAISTGVYGYPAADAARISVSAVKSAPTLVETVLLVAFDEQTAQLWEQELQT